jgi:methyl-accepting chemotaxis protein
MFKNLKLTYKLMISIGCVVLISFTFTVGFLTVKQSQMVRQDAEEKLMLLSQYHGKQIQASFETAFSTARSLALFAASMKVENKIANRKSIVAGMKGLLENNPEFFAVWMGWEPNAVDGMDNQFKGESLFTTPDGQFVPYWYRGNGIEIKPLVDMDKGTWYTGSIDSKTETITEPAVWNIGGKDIFMVETCVPIMVNGKALGVAAVDLTMGQIAELVGSIKPYDNGYAVMITPGGKIAAHPDPNLVGKEIETRYPAELALAIKNGESIKLEFESKTIGGKAMLSAVPFAVGNTGEKVYLLVAAPMDRIMEGVNTMTRFSIMISTGFLVLLGILIFFLARILIVGPINGVVDRLKDISEGEGDLTQRLEVRSKDELGSLASVFNQFIEKLQTMITEISQGVNTLSDSSSQLTGISEKMSKGSEDTSDMTSTVAAATEEMSTNINSISAAMEESSTNTNTVAAAAEEMTATINEIAKNAESAREISEQAVAKVTDSAEQMNRLGDAAKSIGNVVQTITDISAQVNLLSLNATIEAARAGEAGKGFAVVANEIKDLAGQTSNASMDIKNEIDNIQSNVSTTLSGITEINDVINNINGIVSTIATAVEEQSAATREIAENINQASTGIQEVNENVSQSSQVVGEISRDITQVNQSSSDMAERSRQVQISADDLSKLADELNGMVSRFKI